MTAAARRAGRARLAAWGLLLMVPALLAPPLWRHAGERGWCLLQSASCRDNETYAARYFAGLVPVEAVLASREWHTRGDDRLDDDRFGPLNCTFAVVRLGPDAPAAPPQRLDDPRGWWMDWGGQWRPGGDPLAPSDSVDAAEALGYCSAYWSDDMADDLASSLRDPRAFVAEDGPERIFVYDPARRLAARVRFGD